jgi:hypothetical protein
MKRISIGLSMFMLCLGLSALTGVKSIRAEDYHEVAGRLVFDLDSNSTYSAQPSNDILQIRIGDFDNEDAQRVINSKFIREVSLVPGGFNVKLASGLRYEKMYFDDTKQIVIDLFTKPTSKSGRLTIARFYSDRGRYASADKAFSDLNRDFPDSDDILYHWGVLLKRRGSTRAEDILARIPASSTYYKQARSLMEGSDYIPPIMVKPCPELTDEEVEEQPEEPALADSIATTEVPIAVTPVTAVEEQPRSSFWNTIVEIALDHFVLTLGFFVSTLVILSILIFGFKQKSKPGPNANVGFEALSMRRMVNRLLADGWTHKEIARELKITVDEVAYIANLNIKEPEPMMESQVPDDYEVEEQTQAEEAQTQVEEELQDTEDKDES